MTADGDMPDENDGPAEEVGPEALLAAALAAGKEVAEAARETNVSERTAYRRLADPQFKRLLAELRGRMVSQALGRLSATMTKASDRLDTLLDSKSERTQLAAAKAVIGLTQQLREQTEIVERLAALEAAAAGGGKP
jgi:hypothetical protein